MILEAKLGRGGFLRERRMRATARWGFLLLLSVGWELVQHCWENGGESEAAAGRSGREQASEATYQAFR